MKIIVSNVISRGLKPVPPVVGVKTSVLMLLSGSTGVNIHFHG
ncbi:hypothetical protein HMPREF9012_1891 [Bacteroidetes bacterium oral taxon 272 str. F0290]|nr:hypothetical protein HMPREF9012_1891 [Bacteroidetes bacterium oral taxon 272 str. F0290]